MAKILIAGINFAPENIGTGKYTGEMAAWLAGQGHKVRVVTAPPYYPAWKVAAGYRRFWWSREIIDGVEVFRCPIWVPAKPSGLTRIIHLASFGISSLPILLASVSFSPNVIINIAPTLVSAPGVLAAAKLCRSRTWLHVQDFELDAALDMGIVEVGAAKRAALAIERLLLRQFDRVSTISDKMLERILAKGVSKGASEYFPNWADIDGIHPLVGVSSYRAELGIPLDDVVALYSGNMGLKQGLEQLGELAHATADLTKLHFVFGGQGPGRAILESMCSGLKNVHFLDLQPVSRLNDWLGLADIHLLPQRADVADLVMPSKLTGMLASGRPILATAHPGTGVADALRCSGIAVPPGNTEALAYSLRSLVSSAGTRKQLGQAARAQAESTLARGAILGRFQQKMLSLLAQKTASETSTDTDPA